MSRPNNALRALRSARPSLPPATATTRASSSTAGITSAAPTSSSQAPPRRRRKRTPTSQIRVTPTVLSSLVSLHHISASFLHRPADIIPGFHNAFQHTPSDPHYTYYTDLRNAALQSISDRSNLVERLDDTSSGKVLGANEKLRPAARYSRTFKNYGEEMWSEVGRGDGMGGRDLTKELSDRELRVREELLGTWERGGAGMKGIKPSLKGAQEWLREKGVSKEEFAKMWQDRGESK